MKSFLCGVGIAFAMIVSAVADDGLRERIEDDHADGADHWIYNDIAAGMKQARETGKPLFVTFRCVPCEACMGFDAEVANGNDRVKSLADEKFVCVRQVEMKGVDLTTFQFDHDLNWAGMFLNGDGTVYARYGTQSADGPDAYNSVEGLVSTMERVLKLHADYPANKAVFAGKTAAAKPWKTATDMPTLNPTLRNGGETTRSNCIHCHNIHDAENDHWTQQGTMSHDRLWRYPLPDNLGITVAATDGRTVKDVRPDSAAAHAGVSAGRQIDRVNGQAVSSIADIQWALHQIPNQADQPVSITFDDGATVQFTTHDDWKKSDISWRGSMWSLSPKLRVYMPPLSSFQREENDLAEDDAGLLVKWINKGKPGGKAADKAGLREGDIVIKVDGRPVPGDSAGLNAYVKLNHRVGEELQLVVLRKGEELNITVPLVE